MKKMKKILCFLLVFAMAFGCMSGMALAMTWGAKPADGVTEEQPFAPGTGGSSNFRIPCLVTLDDGTLVAACDARWNHSSDACGLDTIVSYSKDNGETWNYTFANYLGDYGNGFNYNASAFIDPSIVTDGKTVYMIADIYPAGIAINTTPDTHRPLTGSTGFDENDNLILAKATDTINGLSASADRISQSFDYYLEKIEGAKEDAENYYQLKYKDGSNVEGYTVDAYFNIKGEGVDTNIFCGDSPYYPWPADYLYMTKSTDGGATWSIPSLINIKRADEATVLVCPGRALVTSTGRIIFPVYEHTSGREYTSVIYSDDNGETWKRSANMTNNCSEAGITEADGRIYMFTRHGGYYVSENNGVTWSARKDVGISYDTGTQLSAITYSEKIDGKTAIMLSVPGGPSRRTNGKIFVALVQEDGSLDWAYDFNVSDNGDSFAYSCLTELANGDIGILWEHEGAAIRYDAYSLDEILGYVKKITIDPEEQYIEECDASTALEITQDPDENIATVKSEYIVEESVILLNDHISNSDSSLNSFSSEAGTSTLDDAVFTFTKNGEYWQINHGNTYLDISLANNYFGTATNLTVEEADASAGTYRIKQSDSRYSVFYTTNMVFDAWQTTNISTVTNTAVKFDLTLLEKQDVVSADDVIPGFKLATKLTSGNEYLITYPWEDGVIVLYPVNGQANQTKLVGDTSAVAKNILTITGVAPGETTAVVGDVKYVITVEDPSIRPDYAGNDIPTEGIVPTAGTVQSNEGSLNALLDGNTETYYHSRYSPSMPAEDDYWITLELEEVTEISGLRYLPRQSSANGRILEYKISYSLDGENWIEITSGKWADDYSWKVAKFGSNVEAKYVKLFATDSRGDGNGRHLTAAELRLVKAAPIVEPPVDEEGEVVRISGKDRYATGYAAADALKETLGVEKFDAVVVATGKNFADALSGSYLAIVKEAPIILTNGKDDNVAELHTYIKESVNANGTVYILGGTAAVPATVEAIESDGYTVKRLAGASRYDTNLEILAEAGITGTELIVATGKEFADSLSASAAGRPILLVKPGAALSAEQKAIAESVKNGNIYVVGGTGAVADATAAELETYATVERIAGSGRQETSKLVAEKFFADAEMVVVASAKNFPDGLCGGPLAAAMNAPLLLTTTGKTEIAENYVQDNALTSGVVLGGTGALSDEAVVDVFRLESAEEIVLK